MTDRRLLVVEGEDDRQVLRSIATRHAFVPEFKVSAEGTWATLLARIPVRLKPGTDLECLGLVVDADADIRSRWGELKRILERAGYKGIPDGPDPSGTIINHEELPRVGVWIMPDNTSPGMLEDFLCHLVPEGDPLLERARRSVDEIPVEERPFLAAHLTRALIHTWLAWQDDPGMSFGQAIAKRYFDSDGPRVQGLLDWLTRLFA